MFAILKINQNKIISFFILICLLCTIVIIGYLMIVDFDCLLFGKKVTGQIESINSSNSYRQLNFWDDGIEKTIVLKNSTLEGNIDVIISKRFNKYTYLSINKIIFLNLIRFLIITIICFYSFKLIKLHLKGKDINSLFSHKV